VAIQSLLLSFGTFAKGLSTVLTVQAFKVRVAFAVAKVGGQTTQESFRKLIVKSPANVRTTQRAVMARCVFVRSLFALGTELPLHTSASRSSAVQQPWSIGNGYEDDIQPGEVSV